MLEYQISFQDSSMKSLGEKVPKYAGKVTIMAEILQKKFT